MLANSKFVMSPIWNAGRERVNVTNSLFFITKQIYNPNKAFIESKPLPLRRSAMVFEVCLCNADRKSQLHQSVFANMTNEHQICRGKM